MEHKAALTQKAAAAASEAVQAQAFQLSENAVYLMGLSFVLGSFFTILILMLLDFMRRDQISGR